MDWVDTLLRWPRAHSDMTETGPDSSDETADRGDTGEATHSDTDSAGANPPSSAGIAGLARSDPLAAVSPLDGRYARRTVSLSPYTSEAALMRARVRVEVEYLISLARLDTPAISVTPAETDVLESLYRDFDADDAALVKRLETKGAAGYEATRHDVKAIEYFIRVRLNEAETANSIDDAARLFPWIHFGLTSEDINNISQRLLVKPAVSEVLVPAIREIRDTVASLAREYRDLPMLARTHGQPATPTTFGKEMAVYATRIGRALGRVDRASEGLAGKLAGASGTYAAHAAAYPAVDWQQFAAEFVGDLGLEHVRLVTQVNPCDDLAALFDAVRGVNSVLLDLDRDAWLYVSDRYFGQQSIAGETGSSTMPHKVNPIDFENSEGNLSKANSDLRFLGEYITQSRLQRDLSDSTVKRNIGAGFAHCLIGYTKTADGLDTVVPNEQVMREELEATPEVIGEAVQTILRREGDTDAYERVKDLTRGERVSLESFRDLFDELDIDETVRKELSELTPAGYTGFGDDLVDTVD